MARTPFSRLMASCKCSSSLSTMCSARIVPLMLFAVIIYACWVFTRSLCIDYLISPPKNEGYHDRRPASAAGLLVLLYVSFFMMVTTYARLFWIISYAPDFVPRGPAFTPRVTPPPPTAAPHCRSQSSDVTAATDEPSPEKKAAAPVGNNPPIEDAVCCGVPVMVMGLSRRESKDKAPSIGPLEPFYMRDVYASTFDGRPNWCSVCCQFKMDRTHHSSDVNRCVRKMDHFCPWVGGIVSEGGWKFFVQFCFYGVVFALSIFVTLLVYTIERRVKGRGVNAHWIVALFFSGILGLFAITMSAHSLMQSCRNLTSIELQSHRTRVWFFSILVPPHSRLLHEAVTASATLPYRIVVYRSEPENGIYVDPARCPNYQQPEYQNSRTFAIVQTRAGENPFDMGSALENFKAVMGKNPLEWALPLKRPPNLDHASPVSMYPLGPVIKRLMREYDLEHEPRGSSSSEEEENEAEDQPLPVETQQSST